MKIKIALAAAILGSSGIIVDARIGSNAGDDKTSSSSTFDTATADLVDEDDIEHRLLQSVDFDAFNPSVQYSDLSVKWARLSERYVLLAPPFGVCLIHYCFVILHCSIDILSSHTLSILSSLSPLYPQWTDDYRSLHVSCSGSIVRCMGMLP